MQKGSRATTVHRLIVVSSPTRTAQVVAASAGLEIVAAVESVEDLSAEGADAVVLDLVGPAQASLQSVQTTVAAVGGDVPVVVIVQHLTTTMLRRLLRVGASGVLLADQLSQALVPSVEAVLAGQTTLPRSLSRLFGLPALSTREKQVLGLVVMRYANGEIARQLHLTEATVKSHLSSAFKKLGVRSRHEAAAMILDPDTGLGTGILAISGPDQRIGGDRARRAT